MTEPAGVAVSIASYRTPDLLAGCLRALETERHGLVPLHVTVVDNGSGDGSAEMVADAFPWVRLIRLPTNVGFGAAHNLALRGTTLPYALVLNSDAMVQPGAVQQLVGYLADHPDVAVVGPRLRYPDGRIQPSRRRFPTPVVFFRESTQLQRFWPGHRSLRQFSMEDRPEDTTQDVDWLVGACLCVRTAAIAEIGLFDERFFLYSEELDWCRRFRAAGWRVVYLPTALVTHSEGGSSRRDLLARDITFQVSKEAYIHKWHGRRLAAAFRAYLLLDYAFRALEEAAKLAGGSRTSERRARLHIIGGYLRHATRA